MTTRPGGLWPKGMLWPLVVAPYAIFVLIGVFVAARGVERALSRLSGSFQLAILVISVAVVGVCVRYLLRADEPTRSRRSTRSTRTRTRSRSRTRTAPSAPPSPVLLTDPPVPELPAVVETTPLAPVAPSPTPLVPVAPAPIGVTADDAIAHLDGILAKNRAERERQKQLTAAAIAEVRGAVAANSSQIAGALERVVGMCAIVAEEIDENRRHTQMLSAVVSRLSSMRSAAGVADAPVSGGTVVASEPVSNDREISLVDDVEVTLVEPRPAEAPRGILCRDNDRWIGDVEVIEVSRDAGSVRYWLRRTSDGYIFPRSFDEDDIRFTDAAVDRVPGSVAAT